MKGPYKEQWEKAIEDEHDRMVKIKVWVHIKHENIDKNVKILSSTWAMKKKANGQFRARITAQRYLQEDSIHYFSDSTAAPVTNETTIKIIFVLLTMSNWTARVVNMRGAFLKGRFANGEEMYLKVPEGFQKFYKKGVVLKLERTIYGLKQVAYAFWKELLMAFKAMGFEKSIADPCLYFKNTRDGLVLWISWVDDCLLVGHPIQVCEYKQKMKEYFDCNNVGELRKYVGCKVERNEKEGMMKMTQSVLIKSFIDKFNISHNNQLVIPASQGKSFANGGHLDVMNEEDQQSY
jgi:Reverse transcriptase (RNA-dependent DNA polymerase)